MQYPETDIRGAVNDDIAPGCIVIKSLVYAFYAQGEPIHTGIGAGGDIKSQAAFAGLASIGERIGEFFTGVDAMCNISTVQQPPVTDIDHIHPLITG